MNSSQRIPSGTLIPIWLGLVLPQVCCGADPLDSWVMRNPRLGVEPYGCVTYANGMFVAVGPRHSLTSSDGVNWVRWDKIGTEFADGINYFGAITSGNGVFVAVGGHYPPDAGFAEGVMASSTDGVEWNVSMLGAHRLSGVAYGNGRFVAVGITDNWEAPPGRRDIVMTSTDGSTWTEVTSGPERAYSSIVFGGGRFVAKAPEIDPNTGEPGARIMATSEDGTTWTDAEWEGEGNVFVNSLIYQGGQFVAVGGAWASDSSMAPMVLTSLDGIQWVRRNPGTSYVLNSVAHGAGKYVAIGYESNPQGGNLPRMPMLVSSDGITWIPSSGATVSEGYGITFGAGRFVAVGGRVDAPGAATVESSTDGTNWISHVTGPAEELVRVAYGNGTFVAVGWRYVSEPGSIFSSGDGSTWATRHESTNTMPRRVVFGDGKFVVVGEAVGGSSGSPGSTAVSTDGITWTTRQRPSRDFLMGLTYGEGIFVAVGYSNDLRVLVLTSPDGTEWTRRAVGSTLANVGYSRDIAHGDGVFVAVATEYFPGGAHVGLIMTSPDGITWERTHTFDGDPYDVSFGNGVFVVSPDAGGADVIFTSPDGVNWTNEQPTHAFSPIAFADGYFFGNGGAAEALATSTDGVNWTPRLRRRINDVTHGNGKLIAVGPTGSVFECDTAPRLTQIKWLPGGTAELTLTGMIGRTYPVEISEDLVSWARIGDVTATAQGGTFRDATAPAPRQRYYRCVWTP